MLSTAGLLVATAAAARIADRGQAIFDGQEPVRGTIRGHREPLPPVVLRCRNCHAPEAGPKPPGTAAPRLDADLLLEQRNRRGGPPSAYDQPTFCKVLRTGIDPASILVAREMPVYNLSDAQCASLWRFLTAKQRPAPRK